MRIAREHFWWTALAFFDVIGLALLFALLLLILTGEPDTSFSIRDVKPGANGPIFDLRAKRYNPFRWQNQSMLEYLEIAKINENRAPDPCCPTPDFNVKFVSVSHQITLNCTGHNRFYSTSTG